MIRRAPSGRIYCDGRGCGFPLAFSDGDPEDGPGGVWVCLDCNSSMYAARPSNAEIARANGAAYAARSTAQGRW